MTLPVSQKDDQARRLLVALLDDMNDGPVDISELAPTERLFAIATCSATMIKLVICEQAGYDPDRALDGLERLMISTRAQIMKRCAEHNNA